MALVIDSLAPFGETLALRLGPLDFGESRWLLALLIFLPLIYFWKTSRVPASRTRRWMALALRTALTLAVVLALAETRLTWFSRGVCVIFVIDQSESVPKAARDAQRQQIQAIIESKMTKDDLFAVIEFGGDSVLASLPSVRGKTPDPVRVIDAARTDISRAIRLALATFPADRQKRIVLISDGNQNSGDALREARFAAMRDADIESVVLRQQIGHEVLVESVSAPPRAQKGADFMVRVIVRSDQKQRATILVERDQQTIYKQEKLELQEGITLIDVPDRLNDGRFHPYKATVIPEKPENDTFAHNNTGYGYTLVQIPGKTLVVRGKVRTDYLGPALARALKVDIVDPRSLPDTPAGLMGYDCIVLQNVGAHLLSIQQMRAVEGWVKDLGGGLVLVGGDDSFGPGGYKTTPLEIASPVEMDVKRKKHLASLALVVVYDKSGSMGMPAKGGKIKLDLANQGTAETIRLLEDTDQAQAGSVDTQVDWATGPNLVPMTPANKRIMIERITQMAPGGGGIFCRTALAHSYDLLRDPRVNAMSRHVIMFADADDAEQQGECVEEADRQFRAKPSITTSVIGLGTEHSPDWAFLQAVAKAGHGRAFITDDAMALPRVFAKEAFIAHRSAWVEDPKGITPQLYESPLLEKFRGVQKVYGYVATTLKPRAAIAMHGKDADDPLLAHWNHGLGKVVAYTSDAENRWGKDWVRWEDYDKFWVQAVRWASRDLSSAQVLTTTTIDGTDGKVSVEAVDSDGNPINNQALEATISGEGQPTKKVPLDPIAPGRYEGKFAASERGTYTVAVSNAKTGGVVDLSGAVGNYPAEYRDMSPNAALMGALAEASNGAVVPDLGDVFAPKPFSVKTFWPLFVLLMSAGAVGLVADVAWRRLNFADYFRPKSRPAPAAANRGDTVGAFKSVRTVRQQVTAVHQAAKSSRKTEPQEPPPAEPARTPAPIVPGQPSPPRQEPPAEGSYTNALLRAKRRAAEQIKEREEKG